ncbi:ABC transporter substrate binding protein [Vibrio hannami]|uniref:ABC transporter substrate-binding protein n=1 Tax=Vibrio hannami TaxID=2717094 RepID=UPI00240ECD65|nr:ABC transporter substrate binding protein [Vibrio hannami]MDG3085778.1 ABC transporter substrate binding protein [Vibrio hannami]
MVSMLILSLVACFSLVVAPILYANNIAIIDSYHQGYAWADSERKGFEEHVDPGSQLTYFEMDTKRIEQSEFLTRANQIWEKIQVIKPDLIVTMDDNALKYFGSRITHTEIGLVFMGVENDPRTYFNDHKIPDNVAGIREKPLVKQSILLISQLAPVRNKRFLLMMDEGTTAKSVSSRLLAGRESITIADIELEIFTTNSYNEWQDKVRAISTSEYDALIIASYASLKDSDKEHIPAFVTTEWTSQHSRVPLFTYWKDAVGKGRAIGGLAISGYEHGANAAQMVNAILNTGELPHIEVQQQGEFILSESELSRWGIELPHFIRSRSTIVE